MRCIEARWRLGASIRRIARECGVAKSTAERYVRELRRRGAVERLDERARELTRLVLEASGATPTGAGVELLALGAWWTEFLFRLGRAILPDLLRLTGGVDYSDAEAAAVRAAERLRAALEEAGRAGELEERLAEAESGAGRQRVGRGSSSRSSRGSEGLRPGLRGSRGRWRG